MAKLKLKTSRKRMKNIQEEEQLWRKLKQYNSDTVMIDRKKIESSFIVKSERIQYLKDLIKMFQE